MQKKKIAQYCCAALVAAGIGLNIQNAIADYGMKENSFSLVAVGGTNTGSNSNSNGAPAGWIVNQYMGKKLIITGGSVGTNTGVNFALIDCCVSDNHSACDPSAQDERC